MSEPAMNHSHPDDRAAAARQPAAKPADSPDTQPCEARVPSIAEERVYGMALDKEFVVDWQLSFGPDRASARQERPA